jgi:CoA-transferase family III
LKTDTSGDTREGALQSLWRALACATAPELDVRGAGRFLGSPFALDEAAVAAIGASLLAAAELAEARGGQRPAVTLERAHAALAFSSERHLRAERPLGPGFAPLSRFAATADGHIRLHANYPHHRAALLHSLGDPPDERSALAAVRLRAGDELEHAIVAAGGAAARVRSVSEWREHPQGEATIGLSPLDLEPGLAEAPALPPPGPLPCSGLRVLDFTRVIAGPVGTRMLAALGAEVLRIDAPQMPELELHVLDGMVGKRSVLLDLRAAAGRARLEELLAGADVVVQGYRPGALAAFGLDRDSLSDRHPHVVTVTLSAWGHLGPWADRRGFDSVVQAACGIALACGDAGQPGALPVQALDHATGYLIAAAALRGLTLRALTGRAARARLALTRTASWIMSLPRDGSEPAMQRDPEPRLVEIPSPDGSLRCLSPPGSLDGKQLLWPRGVPAPGADPPSW